MRCISTLLISLLLAVPAMSVELFRYGVSDQSTAFKDWPRIFAGDTTMSSALLDGLPHHAQLVLIVGDGVSAEKCNLGIAVNTEDTARTIR